MNYQMITIPRTGREAWTPYATAGEAMAAAHHEMDQPNRVYVAVVARVDGQWVTVWIWDKYATGAA